MLGARATGNGVVVLEQAAVDAGRTPSAAQEVGDHAAPGQLAEEPAPDPRTRHGGVQPWHAEVASGRPCAQLDVVQSGGAHQSQAAIGAGRLGGGAREEFAAQGQGDRVDREIAVRAPDLGDQGVHGVGHQARRIGAAAALRQAESGQVEGIDGTAGAEVIVERLDFVGRAGRIDAVNQQQRALGTRPRRTVLVPAEQPRRGHRHLPAQSGQGGRRCRRMFGWCHARTSRRQGRHSVAARGGAGTHRGGL